jgi:toxin YoeB
VKWKTVFTRQSLKDAKKIKKTGLRSQVESLLDILKNNPFNLKIK